MRVSWDPNLGRPLIDHWCVRGGGCGADALRKMGVSGCVGMRRQERRERGKMRGGEGDPRDETWWATPPRFLCTKRIKKHTFGHPKVRFFVLQRASQTDTAPARKICEVLPNRFFSVPLVKTQRSETILNHKMSQERQTPSPSVRHWKMMCWCQRIHRNPRMMRTSYTVSRREREDASISRTHVFPTHFISIGDHITLAGAVESADQRVTSQRYAQNPVAGPHGERL